MSTRRKPRRNRVFSKESYGIPQTPRHLSLEPNPAKSLRIRLSSYSHTPKTKTSQTRPITPITPQFTNRKKPYINFQEMRNERIQKSHNSHNSILPKGGPKLQRAHTDNYYNATNTTLPRIHYLANSNPSKQSSDDHGDTDTDHTTAETEDESVVITDAYSNYHPPSSSPFPDIDKVCNNINNINMRRDTEIKQLQEAISMLKRKNVAQAQRIQHLTNIANNNISVCQPYSDDEEEGYTEDDHDDGMDGDGKNQRMHSTDSQPATSNEWIPKTGQNHYVHRKNSNVLEMKMSELFEQTAAKFLVFLKDSENKEAEREKKMKLETKEKEKLMLELLDKVQENDKLIGKNFKLTQQNNQLQAKILKLHGMMDCMQQQITELNQKCNRAEIKINQQKQLIRTQFEHEHPQQPLPKHQRSATEDVSIDLSSILTAIDTETPATKLYGSHSVANNATLELKDEEFELYTLFKSFIDAHKQSADSPSSNNTNNNIVSSPLYDNDAIFDETEIMSYNMDTLQSPDGIRPNLSFTTMSGQSNESVAASILTNNESSNTRNTDDFTEGTEYKLEDMEQQKVAHSDPNIDTSSSPDVQRLRSNTYWKRKVNDIQSLTRHRLTISRQNIEPGRVGKLAQQFDATLPDKPDELIRNLSNRTRIPVTSGHFRRTTKAKHKHKIKPKNCVRHRASVEEDEDDIDYGYGYYHNVITPKSKSPSTKSPKNKVNKVQTQCPDLILPKLKIADIDNDQLPSTKMVDCPSWRTIMNKQNNERYDNTPRGSAKFTKDGKLHIDKSSLSKVTEAIRRQYK